MTCQPGVILRDLYQFLAAHHCSLPNMGVINKQTVAGAIATGTHGSGLRHQSLSAAIIKMNIMLADGSILEINQQSELNGLSLWDAATISLGWLGIATEITFRTEPLFYLQSEEETVSFNDYLEGMDEFARQYEYFKAWWFPHTDKVCLFKINRVSEELYRHRHSEACYSDEQKRRDREMDDQTSPMFVKSHVNPAMIPEINEHCLNYYFTPRKKIGTSFDILVHDETVPMIVSEYALPLENNRHKQALISFHDKLESSDTRLHFPVDLRYTAAETSWLSSSYDCDSFQIGICVREYYQPDIPEQMTLFFHVMDQHNARPHWGKLFDAPAHAFEQLFPRFDDFKKVKRWLDPGNTFTNNYLDAWFQHDNNTR